MMGKLLAMKDKFKMMVYTEIEKNILIYNNWKFGKIYILTRSCQ